MTSNQRQPEFFLSLPQVCNYLPTRQASMLFVDPVHSAQHNIYDKLIQIGFRRSGDFVYRPHCQSCSACLSARIPVDRFAVRRGQRRTWRKNQDITVTRRPASLEPEHFALYLHYQASRHGGGSMDNPDPGKYSEFLISQTTPTIFYEMHHQDRLVCVSVADRVSDGLSAVYTFYDPAETRRGLGVYAILWLIEEAKRLQLPYLYLGYWIRECAKMAYKAEYRPLEIYQDRAWLELHETG